MKAINLLLAVHNHQPVGNLEEVFRRSWEDGYDPFLKTLENHPGFRTSLHYSGSLLEWLEENQPNFITRIRGLVERGQVELLSGGFYEPLLPSIPERDAIGQVRLSNHYLTEKFKVPPQGLWLAERVWSPTLPKVLAPSGLKYTLLDDSHFRYAGFPDEDIFGYYVTESEGCTLSIFPSNKRLRYAIPFRSPEETLDILRRYATDSGHLAVTYADDGEKFGIWPGTHRWVYQEKWLEKFIGVLEENHDWVHLLTFSEYLEKFPPQGRAYLPPASYDEMMEWALPPLSAIAFEDLLEELKRERRYEKYWPYLRGGIWENFLVKYPESNHMHKKMLRVSQKVHRALQSKFISPKDFPPHPALQSLWKAQDSCAYWHGLFGGLHLNYLRHAVYQNLIAAERLAEILERGGGKFLHHEILDLDKDLQPEVLVTTPDLGAILKPNYGGGLVELDYRPKRFNLTNVLSRRPEAYHRKLKKNQTGAGEESLRPKNPEAEEALFYDWYTRSSFLDHFLGEGATLDQFRRCQYPELGDFVNQPYTLTGIEELDGSEIMRISLLRKGSLWKREGRVPIDTFKRFLFYREQARMEVGYEITNRGPAEIGMWFGVEVNLTLLAGDDPQRYYLFPGLEVDDRRLCSSGAIPEVEHLRLHDEAERFEVSLELSPKGQLWRFPLETVSQSESGIQKTFQGTVLLFHWPFSLKPEETKSLGIQVGLEGIRLPG
jgi:4-alpha-glucanotransferase